MNLRWHAGLWSRLRSCRSTHLPSGRLGATGIEVTRPGFGLGGIRKGGFAMDRACGLAQVRGAWKLGIRYFDTARAYGNEEGLAEALSPWQLERCVVSSKYTVEALRQRPLRECVEESLRATGLGHLDICFIHHPSPDQYPEIRDRLLPVMQSLKQEGKIRATGLTEAFTKDSSHRLLLAALADRGAWDVFMVGYNFVNQSAARSVFPGAREQKIGLVGMFAVRNVFSRPERFRETLEQLAGEGSIAREDLAHPLILRLLSLDASGLASYAYRFCRDQTALDTVLIGTASSGHLRENITSFLAPPLGETDHAELARIFARVENVSGH